MKQGWEVKKLGEVILKTEMINPTKTPNGVYDYVDVSSVNNLTMSISSVSKILGKEAPSRARKLIKSDDIIFATVRPTLKRIAIIPSELNNQICSTGYFVLRPKPLITNKWLFYYLLRDEFMAQMEKLQKGASYPAVTDSQVREQNIPYPQLISEQERIVRILDSAFAKIETLRANAEQNLKKAKELFQASLKQELTPKQGWDQKVLLDISTNLDNKRVPITKEDRSTGAYPYYGASGIVDYVDDYIFDDNLLLISEDGANLLARSTPIAFSVSGKIWVNNHAHVIKFSNIYTQRYIEHYFASVKIDEFVTGAAQPKLNQKALNSIRINIPVEISEQQAIVEKLDALNERCQAMEENYRQTVLACDDLKQALLRKAFNGEL